MTIQEKIKKANELQEQVNGIKSFIDLAHKAQMVDEKNAKSNELNGINKFIACKIIAFISTGSQSPIYEQTIIDNDTIVCLMTCGLVGVEEKLKQKEEELQKLFN